MVLHEQRFRGLSSALFASIFALLSVAVSFGTEEKDLLSGFDIFVFALPGLEDGCLERSTIGECQNPRFDAGDLIDGVKALRGVDFGLASRQEDNSYKLFE